MDAAEERAMEQLAELEKLTEEIAARAAAEEAAALMAEEAPAIYVPTAAYTAVTPKVEDLQPAARIMIPILGLTKAELTINNGYTDATFSIKRYRKDKDMRLPPELFWVDIKDSSSRWGWRPVGFIRCYYATDPLALPTYRFNLSNKQDRSTSPAAIYAAHLVFLQLTGVNVRTTKWTDATGREQMPTRKYEIQAVTSCMACGRKLRKPSSIDVGYGKFCADKIGASFNYDTRVIQRQ